MDNDKFISIIDNATEKFRGDITHLSRAIGMLAVGRRLGWRVTYLIYSRATVRKYEKLLYVSIQDVLPEKGDLAEKSLAGKALKKVDNFWKAVKGEIPGIRSTMTTQD
ncbi:hypothetical protein Ga0123461_1549 [Mariprofundus aestuarium]|uniref:Uncharacterized protein n=1 Tax=Mariprofundus aestuarium TaxID=1921086 RepID=A0A2K8KYH0_MARES|nr:hypothetical protein [Mariprofundus aestuarium]ATX79963.1 hypothetical protein Ga0123461_1549 [Mariprofundus aestuarium]